MTYPTDQDWNDGGAPAWTSRDDEVIRAALMTLRDDVDMLALPDPAVVRASSGVGAARVSRVRRHRALTWVASVAAAVVAVAAIAFAQLGRPEAAPVLPAHTDPTTAVATGSPTTGTSEPTEPPAELIEPCGARPGVGNTTGVSAPVAATAEWLLGAALACDREALIQRADADGTELSFGAVTAEAAFAIPARDESANRYRLLSALLTLPPQVDAEFGFTRWPAEPRSDADWQVLIDTGVITATDRDLMEQGGTGYTGYRVVIDESGTWTAFIGGD